MIALNDCGVVFDRDNHTYNLNGKFLDGVTGMIKNIVFPEKYKGVSESVLHNAATRGTMIHDECDLADNGGLIGGIEAQNYLAKRTEMGLTPIATEYLVTDGVNFASAIDKVFETEDGKVIIGDIKTTSVKDDAYVSWQLSLYKRFFEAVNPGVKVSGMVHIWLRGEKCEITPVGEIDGKYLDSMIEAYLAKDKALFTSPYDMPEELRDKELEIVELLKMEKEIKDKVANLKADILALLDENMSKSFTGAHIKVTRKADSHSMKFDQTAFKKAEPEVFAKYCKESVTKGSLLITILD